MFYRIAKNFNNQNQFVYLWINNYTNILVYFIKSNDNFDSNFWR